MNILQHFFSGDIGKAEILHLKHRLRLLSFRRKLGFLIPAAHLFPVRSKIHGFDMLRQALRLYRAARMLQRRDIERLADALLLQHIHAEKLVRLPVSDDLSVSHHHDAVHIPVKRVLQTMPDDQHRFSGGFADLIDQVDRPLSGGRVQIRQGLVKQEDIHIVDHHARHGNPLLLSAGQLRGRMVQKRFHIHRFRHLVHPGEQLLLRDAVVFQRKGDILRHRQPDELPVRILQHGPHQLGHSEDPFLCRVLSLYGKASRALSRKGKRDQSVDAVRQS